MSLNVNSAGLASSNPNQISWQVGQSKEIIHNLMNTYKSLDFDSDTGSRILNVLYDLDSFMQTGARAQNLTKSANLFNDAIALEHHLETADPEMLEVALEEIDGVKGKKKKRLKYAADRGFLIAYEKLKGKVPEGLLDKLRSSGQSVFVGQKGAAMNDKEYLEAMIAALVEDGAGIDDLGELCLIMMFLSMLGIRASVNILEKVSEALNNFLNREVNAEHDPQEILAFLNAVKEFVSSVNIAVETPDLEIRIENIKIEIDEIKNQKSMESTMMQKQKESFFNEEEGDLQQEVEVAAALAEEMVPYQGPHSMGRQLDITQTQQSNEKVEKSTKVKHIDIHKNKHSQQQNQHQERTEQKLAAISLAKEKQKMTDKPAAKIKPSEEVSASTIPEKPVPQDIQSDLEDNQGAKAKVPYLAQVPISMVADGLDKTTPTAYRIEAKSKAQNNNQEQPDHKPGFVQQQEGAKHAEKTAETTIAYQAKRKKNIETITQNINQLIEQNKDQVAYVFVNMMSAMFEYKLGDAADLMNGFGDAFGINT
jgi:hypothetical protein